MEASEEQHKGLVLNPPDPEHWFVGSGKATERFGATTLNPTGDWTLYHPQDENQRKGNLETDACVVFGSLKAWITLSNFLGIKVFPKDLSERYSGALGGTTQQGTDPQEFAEITRTKIGIIPQEFMPWSDDIETWDEYFDQRMAQQLLPYGQQSLSHYQFGHEWIFAWGSTYTPQEKAQMLAAALKRGPVCVSVSGYYRYDNQGRLFKNPGEQDTHWVLLLKQTDHGTIHDQYSPFIKELAANYDHMAAKLYFLQEITTPLPAKKTFLDQIWDLIGKLNIWRGLNG